MRSSKKEVTKNKKMENDLEILRVKAQKAELNYEHQVTDVI